MNFIFKHILIKLKLTINMLNSQNTYKLLIIIKKNQFIIKTKFHAFLKLDNNLSKL